ncbi:hypothetical protein [Magnetospirillum fulvum]|uniref:Uncharacterized protein n=1 Tax=Magnetospirillum fulvum TaxID=1082 RepID=A0A1H6IXE0_MAGFU|nr:hypothetical protein [Magnetospirillum fulvum]SEH51744.1 hypothetical protein SAMN04244559_02745 [Magnetospirillum fulvum]
MRLLFALCVALGFGAMLVGSAVVAPRSSSAPVWSGADGRVRGWEAAAASSPAAPDFEPEESEETTCPDWRLRQ